MDKRHAHNALIDAVGPDAVSERFKLTPQALHNWRLRGIPHLKRLAFKQMADERGVRVPGNFLEMLAA